MVSNENSLKFTLIPEIYVRSGKLVLELLALKLMLGRTLLNEPLRPFFADLTPKVADKIVLLFSKAILTQSFRL